MLNMKKSYQPTASMDTGADGLPGVRVLLSNLTDYSYIQSDDQNLWYNNSGNFQCIKQCQVNLEDTVDVKMTNNYHGTKSI